MKVITVVNRKGGVSKSTSTMNLACELSVRGFKVLSVDLDPQASLTAFAGFGHQVPRERTVLAALMPEKFPRFNVFSLAAPASWGGLLWPASSELAEAEAELSGAVGAHQRLRTALRKLGDSYDFVLVDSPPSVGNLVFSGMGAADYLLVPVACDLASMDGLATLMGTLELFREHVNPDLELLGVFGTLRRPTLHATESLELLAQMLPGKVFATTIPMAVAVQDAQSSRQAIRQYRPHHPAAEAYEQLTDELLAKLKAPLRLVEAPAPQLVRRRYRPESDVQAASSEAAS